ncbi:MAG: type IV toxin-antitoxin system AbiEi family antitoxin [Pseudomonadales bacterium]
MNKQIETLPAFLEDLLSSGRVSFTRDEAQQRLGMSRAAFLSAAARLQRQGKLLLPRHGFYVIVPPQYYSWGAPPPEWYIDGLMQHEDHPYYVALLKAAEMHGASHQAVMEFQVITNKQIPMLLVGRSNIAFYFRRNISAVSEGIEAYKTDAGYIRLAGVELTALDLLRYPHAAGGLDHIATVLTDLAKKLDPAKLGFLATAFERNYVQRLGFLLDYLGHDVAARHLLRLLENMSSLTWTELDPPPRNVDPDLADPVTERDRRWRMIVRRPPEVDE